MKKALITGITGQDGSYLAEYLLNMGYEVYGLVRRLSSPNYQRIENILPYIKLVKGDLIDEFSLSKILESIKPNEIYNLAAQSFVPESWEQPILTTEITALGVLKILNAIKTYCPDSHFYQASSSEMFGKVQEIPQNEKTPFYPRSPYGISKLYAHWITINYRESFKLFACSGILFNHESPRRGIEFVTRKITNSIAKIKYGILENFELGNLSAKRDWGFAGDYVKAMHLMLNKETPEDYVIATGETHEVREFCDIALRLAGFNYEWEGNGLDEKCINKNNKKIIIKINKFYYRPAEVDILIGNPKKAKENLGWNTSVSFEKLVELMLENDLNKIGEKHGK